MTKKEVRKSVKQSIIDGKTKQEIFDELKETSKLPKEDLAKIIQSTPSLQVRQKYKTLQIVLIVLLSITVLFKVVTGIPIVIQNGIKWFPILFILPIINIILLWAVATYSPGSHRLVAIFTILSLLRTLGNIKSFELLMLIDFAVAAGLIVLGFYLNSKLCPDFITVKEKYQNSEGQDRLRNVIKFED